MRARQVPDAWGLNMVLFGIPGTGKTTLAATAQDSEYGRDTLFIDVEGGSRAIADRDDIDIFRPERFGEVREMYEWLVESEAVGENRYRTIVVDTINELQRLDMQDIMAESRNDEPGWPEYRTSTEHMGNLVRAFRNLSQTKGWNVIFIAHAAEQKDEVTGNILVRPNLTPKASEMICGAVDVVGYLMMNRDGDRRLLLKPTSNIVAKYRQPLNGPQLPTEIDDPTLVPLLEHLRQRA